MRFKHITSVIVMPLAVAGTPAMADYDEIKNMKELAVIVVEERGEGTPLEDKDLAYLTSIEPAAGIVSPDGMIVNLSYFAFAPSTLVPGIPNPIGVAPPGTTEDGGEQSANLAIMASIDESQPDTQIPLDAAASISSYVDAAAGLSGVPTTDTLLNRIIAPRISSTDTVLLPEIPPVQSVAPTPPGLDASFTPPLLD